MLPYKLLRVLFVILATIGAAALLLPTMAAQPQLRTDLYGDPLPSGALMRLGTIRLRHVGSRIAFSNDGKHLLSFSNRDNTLRHWDLTSGRELRHTVLQGAEYIKRRTEWAWAGKTVVFQSGEHFTLWDAFTGRERRRIELGKTTIHALALSPSGDTLAAAMETEGKNQLRLWSVDSGKELHHLELPQAANDLAFSPDGKTLAGAVEPPQQENLYLWEVSTGKRLRMIHGAGRQIAFSSDGSKIAAVAVENHQGVLRIWNVANGREVAVMPKVEGAFYDSVHFSPNGKLLAVDSVYDVMLFDLAARKLLRRLPCWGRCSVFAPDGKTLASAGVSAIHLWDTTTWREIEPRPCQDGLVSFLAATPDGHRLVSQSTYDSRIHLWDVSSSKSLAALRAGERLREVNTAALSADGKRLASGDAHGKVRVWDLDTAREVLHLNVDLRNAQGVLNPELLELSFVSGANRLAAVSSAWHTISGSRPKYQLDLWDLDTGKSLARRALAMESWPASFTAEGRTIVFRAQDRLIVQDVDTGREWVSLSGGLREPLAWSPDGQILAATIYETKTPLAGAARPANPQPDDSRTIVLMELATGKQLRRIETGRSSLRRLAYSPDGRTLAGTVSEGFRVWEVATGKELFHRPLQRDISGYPFAMSLTFFPDGGRLATGLWDGSILIWDLEPQTWRAGHALKDLAPRDLERLWADLAGEDAAKAYQAVGTLASLPAKAVPFLKGHLRPTPALDAKQVRRLIADLDSPEFAVREAAEKKLASFGEQAEPALRQALESKPSLEMRRRLEALHADAERASRGLVRSTELLRTLRAIRVLEQIGDRKAQQVLQTLAGGDPAARATRQAKDALRRLANRLR